MPLTAEQIMAILQALRKAVYKPDDVPKPADSETPESISKNMVEKVLTLPKDDPGLAKKAIYILQSPARNYIPLQTQKLLLDTLVYVVLTQKGLELVQNALYLFKCERNYIPQQSQKLLNDRLVGIIYQTMPHPPQNLSGFDFRSSTGADNLGKAGMPYARTVPVPVERTAVLPPAQEVFDRLMKRDTKDGKENFWPNQDGLNSLTFAFGTLVIHSVFHTIPGGDRNINNTSSYFDLSPLYGDNDEQCNKVRCKTGRGLLYPDCFLDDRFLFLPPAAAVILVLFNRNHNNIAKELLKQDNGKKWENPPPFEDPVKRDRQDEEIFQTARLINCHHFVNIVITDYVGGLMGCSKYGGGWPMTADPFGPINLPDLHVGRGEGNLVSIEFNTLYRWHSTMSKADVEWANRIFLKATMNQEKDDLKDMKPEDYHKAAQAIMPLAAPKDRGLAELKRNADGRFSDKDLAKKIYDAIEEPAGEFRARGSPEVMSFIDVRGIEWARTVNMCKFNEFRETLGMPKYKSFSEWNANEEIAVAASKLYDGKIDDLELYPGLHAEGHKDDGLIMPPDFKYDSFRVHTMRIALLFDAIALIRGDRFFTHPDLEINLTKWGYDQVKRDPTNKAYGGHIYKHLFDTIGEEYFTENSSFSWFPMTLPTAMEGFVMLQNNNNIVNNLVFNRPNAPN